MQLLFFDAADTILFTRDDAESAKITYEQLQFQALFPYDAEKEIHRGMRVGVVTATGDYQAFEVRKVRTVEPDHFQEITAEHIAISDLTDEFHQKRQWTNRTAEQALSWLLTNTGWSIGTVSASNTSSYDMSVGDVWSAIKNIEQNWNVYILPRVTVDAGGITGKYLDIVPAGGTWRGFRVSLDKNANEIGVIWDDSKLKTALYAFGQEINGSPLTFKDVVWSKTADHPAKPAGQTYLEDADATAAFGRNGKPRFGYYQNASITNANTLLQKTWETLKTVNVPDVCIDSTVSDLYRLGYSDVPIRLHDMALVEVKPTGVVLQKEIIQYTEDLLDPLQSRLTIGVYIPNIVYINRQANKRYGGGRGSGGQTNLEYTTANNTVQFWTDSNGLHSLCVGTGAQLNPDGSLVVDPVTGKPVFIDTGDNMWSQIEQNKSRIALKVTKGDVATQLSVECGNVHVTGTSGAANLVVDGYIKTSELQSEISLLDYVECGTMLADHFGDGTGVVNVNTVIAEDIDAGTVSGQLLYGGTTDIGNAVFSFGTPTASGGKISIPWTKVDGTAGTPINFNIADTQYYKDGVSAALRNVTMTNAGWRFDDNEGYLNLVTNSANSRTVDVSLPTITLKASSGWTSAHKKTVNAYGPNDSGIVATPLVIDATDVYSEGWDGLMTAASSDSYVSLGSSSSATGSITKTTTGVNGYVWVKDSSGTWQRRRTFSISHTTGVAYHKSSVYSGSISVKVYLGNGYKTISSSAMADSAWNNL